MSTAANPYGADDPRRKSWAMGYHDGVTGALPAQRLNPTYLRGWRIGVAERRAGARPADGASRGSATAIDEAGPHAAARSPSPAPRSLAWRLGREAVAFVQILVGGTGNALIAAILSSGFLLA